MEVKSVRNLYRGVNPHFNSKLQQVGGWRGFHNTHIVFLTREMKARLRNMGYTAEIEDSLQIRREEGWQPGPRADIAIYQEDPYRLSESLVSDPSGAGAAVSVMEALPMTLIMQYPPVVRDKPYRAVAVYEVDESRSPRGKPVAWVELLSPSNKFGGRDFGMYWTKRERLLRTGIVFVEIDYLHELPPTIGGVRDYSTGEPAAHPYRILVTDPRPAFDEGQAYVYEFDVDTPLPTVRIPLEGDDALIFSFNVPYQRTYTEMLYGDEVDYDQLPERFDIYSEVDQLHILARMLAIVEAAERGEDLEEAEIVPVDGVTLEEALASLGRVRS